MEGKHFVYLDYQRRSRPIVVSKLVTSSSEPINKYKQIDYRNRYINRNYIRWRGAINGHGRKTNRGAKNG
jgi:hypothetical protein